ncbi:hypothetical protein Ait01nite_090870 [Actinoplanes italicus]|nr:hypothetical protein Ait01nite_090870 [Actinoplanes italicus]
MNTTNQTSHAACAERYVWRYNTKVMTIREVRRNFAAVVDAVIDDAEETVIPRGEGKAVVIVSLDEWHSMRETLHVLGSAASPAPVGEHRSGRQGRDRGTRPRHPGHPQRPGGRRRPGRGVRLSIKFTPQAWEDYTSPPLRTVARGDELFQLRPGHVGDVTAGDDDVTYAGMRFR